MTKLIAIEGYLRRAPADRYAAIREAKTAQLYEEIHGDHMTEMLCAAMELELAGLTAAERARIEETY